MTAAASHIPNGERPRAAGGFTYVGLIILVAIIGLVAATTVRVGVTLQRAQAERDLLHIGEQFSNALKSYAAATPAGQPRQPATLKELLKDPRFPGIRRHLRKIFVDPMTGKAEWGIIYLADNKGILGIYSLSAAQPIKISNFSARFQAFNGKQKISEWVFTFDGQEPLPPAQVKPGQPGQLAPRPGEAPATPGTGSLFPGTQTSKPPAPPATPDAVDDAPVETPPVEAEPAEPEPAEPEPVEPEQADPVQAEPAGVPAQQPPGATNDS
ncbi:type II secretion system protein [Pseudoduganella umbonata]|uniref:Type II secretion system protein n=1 Tax=Pseudoduganella umbonata TaxID=864828 RepID=A0A4P8HV48_9BURK|nr:type II secretion system protein [Pseudoduganella umbonata]MBB3223169.1 type II secretory pathway pseudopilin PulG [Pseudoduganella umbonata]QCP13897.1 type II secretion system protein [Pseudoduganella umbonata]